MPLINTIHCKILTGLMKRCKSKQLDLSGKCFDVATVVIDDDDEVVVVMTVMLTVLIYVAVIYFITQKITSDPINFSIREVTLIR